MERRKALAVAAAGAGVFSTGLVASAAVAGFHLFGFGAPKASASESYDSVSPAAGMASAIATAAVGTSPPPVYVKEIDFVDDYIVVTPRPRPHSTTAPSNTTPATSPFKPTPIVTEPEMTEPATTEHEEKHPPTTAKATTSTTRPHTSTTHHSTSSTSDD